MQVKVRYLGLIRGKLGKKGDEIKLRDGAPLSELLDKLAETYGESIKELMVGNAKNILDPTFIITVNGVLAGQLHGMDTRLYEGDNVALMTLISGG